MVCSGAGTVNRLETPTQGRSQVSSPGNRARGSGGEDVENVKKVTLCVVGTLSRRFFFPVLDTSRFRVVICRGRGETILVPSVLEFSADRRRPSLYEDGTPSEGPLSNTRGRPTATQGYPGKVQDWSVRRKGGRSLWSQAVTGGTPGLLSGRYLGSDLPEAALRYFCRTTTT